MTKVIEHTAIFIIIAPLTGALLLSVLSKLNLPQIWRDIIAFISLVIPGILLIYFIPSLLASPLRYELGGWPSPYGITIVLDSLSVTMATITVIVTITTFVYSLEIREILPKGEKYYILFLFMTTGLYGVFLSGDVINRYVFFELTVLTTYVLLTYTDTKESLRASYIYLVIGSVASFFFLIGIGLIYFNTGYLDFSVLSELVPNMSIHKRNLIFMFILVAVSVKSGLIPFHTWLPDAHVSAPSPMTAVLAGITVKTGVYILVKFMGMGFITDHIRLVMIIIGFITAFIAVLVSHKYWDLKRILAWHTIAQMGLIVAVLSLWNISSVAASIFHLVSHAIFKILLFLSIGAVFYQFGTRDIREISLFKNSPILIGAFLVGILSLVGIPPMNGFYSKTLMLRSLEEYLVLYVLFIIVQILTVSSFFRVLYHSSKGECSRKPFPVSILLPTTVLAGLSIFIGCTTTIWMNNIISPSAQVLTKGYTITNHSLLEIELLTSIHGIILLLTIPVGIGIGLVSNKLKKPDLSGWLTKVDIADSVRYIIIVLAIYLLFTLL
ncbi:MAG: proton-conducting transporter membrane subunit [Candidatus Saliniplasma sp.]